MTGRLAVIFLMATVCLAVPQPGPSGPADDTAKGLPAVLPDSIPIPKEKGYTFDRQTWGDTDSVSIVDSNSATPLPTPKTGRFQGSMGLSWMVFMLPELENWENRIRSSIVSPAAGSNGTPYSIKSEFDRAGTAFSPHAGISWNATRGYALDGEFQYFRVKQSIVYGATDTGKTTETELEEGFIFQGTPLSFWLRKTISDSFFSVARFDAAFLGLGVVALPWTKLTLEGDRFQSPAWGIGKSIGYGIKLGVSKRIGPRWKYNGELRYLSAPIRNFRSDGQTLRKNSLLEKKNDPLELQYGSLEIFFNFAFGPAEKTTVAGTGNQDQSSAR